jgi:hypothetical protein
MEKVLPIIITVGLLCLSTFSVFAQPIEPGTVPDTIWVSRYPPNEYIHIGLWASHPRRTVTLTIDRPILFGAMWGAKEEEYIDGSVVTPNYQYDWLTAVSTVFTIDGLAIGPQGPAGGWNPARLNTGGAGGHFWISGFAYVWKPDPGTHTVSYSFTLSHDVYDGYSWYPQGTTFTGTFEIEVIG